MKTLWFVLLCLSSACAWSANLQPLSDSQLSGVTGREGVAMNFDYGMNVANQNMTVYSPVDGHAVTLKRGDPLPGWLIDPSTDKSSPYESGAYLSALANANNGCIYIAGGPNACSMAVATNNRPGMWVMMKDMWAILKMHNFWIDGGKIAGNTNGAGGTWTLTMPGNANLPAHATNSDSNGLPNNQFKLSNANYDETRFYSQAGTCLLTGKSNGSCNMAGLPALSMEYDPNNAIYNLPDVTWELHIGRVTMQGNTSNSGNPAYLSDTAGSFMTYQVTDFNQNEAKIHYGGRVLMYGF